MSKKPNQIIFLGTGTSQGVPVIGSTHPVCLSDNPRDKRLRASVMVQYTDKNILIDCGPDFRQQMLRENLNQVDAILITHEHNDHIIGLDDVRPLNFKTQKAMPTYAKQQVLNEIQHRFPYVFAQEKYPGAPSMQLNAIDDNAFWIDEIKIIPLPAMHGNLPVFGYRIGNMAYLTDINFIPESTFNLLNDLEILVIDALRVIDKHHSHLTLEESVHYAKRIGAKQTYFTHMNQNIGFHEEVNAQLPPHMQLAHDGLKVEFT